MAPHTSSPGGNISLNSIDVIMPSIIVRVNNAIEFFLSASLTLTDVSFSPIMSGNALDCGVVPRVRLNAVPESEQALTNMTDVIYAEVGARVSNLRNRRGLTQEELGDAVSLTRTSITNIERGRQKVLLHTLLQLAQALDVSVNDLLPDCSKDGNPDSLKSTLRTVHPDERRWIEGAL